MSASNQLKLALPKGRIFDGVCLLLRDAGIQVKNAQRSYRPLLSLPGWDAKLLKPQSVVEMLARGTRDVGFTGADWVVEKKANLVELVDTGLDPVRLVAAAPAQLLDEEGKLPARPIAVATEYPNLAASWLAGRGYEDQVLRSHGATEVYPPEDADCIVDNTSTGATLAANGLTIVAELMRSSTRMFASVQAMEDAGKRREIEALLRLVRSVLQARKRVMIEMNLRRGECLDALVQELPCMGQPTVSTLHGGGYAVKAAILRKELPELLPRILAVGGSDIVVSKLEQIIAEPS